MGRFGGKGGGHQMSNLIIPWFLHKDKIPDDNVTYQCPLCHAAVVAVDSAVGWTSYGDGFGEQLICGSCEQEFQVEVKLLSCAALEKQLPGCGVFERRFLRGLRHGYRCMKCNLHHPLADYKKFSKAADSSGGPGYFHEKDILACPTCGAWNEIGTHWEYNSME
jgi:hypothetical protein